MDRPLKVESLMRKPKQKDYSSLRRGHGEIIQDEGRGHAGAPSAGLGAVRRGKELVMDHVMAVFVWIRRCL